jgi:hypothetical protein
MRHFFRIAVKRAGRVADHLAPATRIIIEEEMPELGRMSLAEFDAIFQSDAEAIENALHMALPGGTYDRLLVLMLQRKASHFIVPWATPMKEET